MKKSLLASALGALMLLGACTTATPYQAADSSDRGYTDTQVENNRWMVSFSGNSLTDRQTVETYLLYRAAELTSQQGFQHFRVVKRETEGESRFLSTGYSHSPYYSGFYPRYAFYGYGGHRLRSHHFGRGFHSGYRSSFHDPYGYGFGASDYREVVRYEATAEIILGRGPKPADDPAFFDAEDVLINLSGKIQRPEV